MKRDLLQNEISSISGGTCICNYGEQTIFVHANYVNDDPCINWCCTTHDSHSWAIFEENGITWTEGNHDNCPPKKTKKKKKQSKTDAISSSKGGITDIMATLQLQISNLKV